MNRKAFSLIELSIVILIIGIIIAGVTQSSRLVKQFKISAAKTTTESSPVTSIENLQLWYETTLDDSFLSSETENNSAISTWYDSNPQSSIKDDATQSNASYKPLYIEDAFDGTIPGVRFDGSDDFFSFGGQYIVNSDYTIISVIQRRSNKVGNYYMSGTSGSTANKNIHLGYVSDTSYRFAHWGNTIDIAASAYSNPIPEIHTHILSSTDGKTYWLNGGDSADNSSSSQTQYLLEFNGPAIGKKLTTGDAEYYNGDIAEIIIYNRALKKEERQSIETYLSKKYNIIIS